MTVIEVVFFHRLDNVYTLFAAKYAQLVACKDYHDYQQQEAAKCTNFGWQRIFALVQIYLIRVTELVCFL